MVETLQPPLPLSLTPVDPLVAEAAASFFREQGLGLGSETPARGILGQMAVGAVRGPITGLANIPRALSAIPPLRSTFEPIATGIESLAPAPSGGAVEAGVESATAFLTDLLLFKGGAGIVGRFAPRIGAALTSRTGLSSQIIGTFAGSEFAQTRQELEQINQQLPAGQKIPTDEITRSALISAAAEAGPEMLSTPFVVGNLLRLMPGPVGQAVGSALRGLVSNPQSAFARSAARLARVAAPVAEIAATEVPTEAATAAIQAAERQRVLAGTGTPTPGALEAVRQSVLPTLISSGLIAGAGRLGRRPPPAAPPPAVEQPLEVPAGAPPPERLDVRPEPETPQPPTPVGLTQDVQRFAQTLLPGTQPQLTPQEIRRVIEPEMPSAVEVGLRRRGLPGFPPPPRPVLTGIPIIGQGLTPLTQPQEQPAQAAAETARTTPAGAGPGLRPGVLPSALEAGLQRRGMAPPTEAPGLATFRASAQNLAQALGAPVPETVPQAESFVAELPLTVRRAAAEDAALEFVIAQSQAGFAGFNFQAARDALQRLYNLPTEAEATRILTAALGAAQQPVTLRPEAGPGPAEGVTAPPAGGQAPPGPAAVPLPVRLQVEPAPPQPAAVVVPPAEPGPAPAAPAPGPTGPAPTGPETGAEPPEEPGSPAVLPSPEPPPAPAPGPAPYLETGAAPGTGAATPAPQAPGAAPPAARPGRPAPTAAPQEPREPATTPEARQQALVQAVTGPGPASAGRVETVQTEAGTAVETRFAVVEAADLIPSHDLALNVNPAFPQELQPRDRSRVSSATQIQSILGRLDPERLAESRVAGMGAPIVGPDLVVESGNARTLAILQGYQQQHEGTMAYQQFLRDNAERFGISQEQLASLRQPVLVRVRRTALTPAQRVAFAREANIPSTQQMSAVERAQADAALLTPALLAVFNPSDDGNIAAASNREFVSQFVQALPETERSELRTREGQLSQSGLTRIRNALFYRVYGNIPALERLAEDTDSNIKNLTNALTLATRDLARLQRGIAEGSLYPINPIPDLMAAVTKFSALRDENETVQNYLDQGGLFGEELSPLAKDMLRFLDANKRSARRIAEVLQRTAAAIEAVGDPRQVLLPGVTQEIPTAAEVFVAAVHAVEETHGQQLALTSGAVSQPGAPGGGPAVGGATPPAASPPDVATVGPTPPAGRPEERTAAPPGPAARRRTQVTPAPLQSAASIQAAEDLVREVRERTATMQRIFLDEFPPASGQSPVALSPQQVWEMLVPRFQAGERAREVRPLLQEAGFAAEAAIRVADYAFQLYLHHLSPFAAQQGGRQHEGPAQLEEPALFFPSTTTPGGERADASDVTREMAHAAMGTLVLTEAGDNAHAAAAAGRGVLPARRGRIRVTPKGRGVLELTRTIPENDAIEELRTTGQAAYVGRSVRGRDDIAVLGQTLRDPRMEHFSVVGVDASGLAIFYEGVSSRLPSSAAPFLLTATERRAMRRLTRAIQRAERAGDLARAEDLQSERGIRYTQIQERAIRDLGARLQAAGAVQYYLVHNHPSTNLQVSAGDVNVTTRIAGGIRGFQGHIVLDSGAYSFIGPDLQLQEKLPLPADFLQPVDPFHVPANPNVLSQEPIRGNDDIVRLGMMVGRQDAVVAFFLTTQPAERGAFQVRGALLIPTTVWNKAGITAYLRKRQAEYGGQQVVTFSNSPSMEVHEVARRLFDEGALAEHVAVFSGIGSDATVSLLQEAGYNRPRRTAAIALGVAVQEEPRQYQVQRAIPETLEGVQVSFVNKAFQEYMIAAGMAERAGEAQMFDDVVFQRHKVVWQRAQPIVQERILKLLQNPPRVIERMKRDIKRGAIPDKFWHAALTWWQTALLNSQHIRLARGDTTRADFDEFRSGLMKSGLPGLTAQIASSYGAGLGFQSRKQQDRVLDFGLDALVTRIETSQGPLTPAQRTQVEQDLLRAVELGDAAVLQLFEQTTDPTLLEMYWELYYGGLLSGIPTQTVNAIGTQMHIAFNDLVIEGTATAMDWAIAGLTGRQRTKHFAALLNGFRATWGNWREGYREALVWWKSPLPRALGGEGQLAEPGAFLTRGGRRQAASERMRLDVGAEAWARATPASFPERLPLPAREQLAKFFRAAAPFVGAATRGMAAMDVAAKAMAGDGTVARLATEEAIRRGLPQAEQQAFLQYVRTHLEEFPDIEQEMNRAEQYQTFNDAPGLLANAIIGIRSTGNTVIDTFFRLMFPFAGTPDRLIARGIELLPGLGLLVGLPERGIRWRGFLPALKAGDSQALEIAAKQLVGLFLTAMLALLWEDDRITGPLSKHPAERDSQLRRGYIPNAILIGDQAYEYRRFEPLSLPMGVWTSAFEAMREVQARRRREGQDTSRPALLEEPLAVAAAATNNTLRFILDSSYFSGVARFFESLSPSGGGVVQGLGGQLTSAVIPFVSALRQSARVLESTGFLPGTSAGEVQVRERETLGQVVRAGLPGVSAGVRPRLEVTGEPRAFPLTPLEALVSPVRRAERSQDPVERELARLDYFPGQPTVGALRQAIGRQPTDDEVFAYRQRRGQLAFQELGRLVEAPFFERLTDDNKRTRIKQAFARATKRARRELFGRARAALAGVEA